MTILIDRANDLLPRLTIGLSESTKESYQRGLEAFAAFVGVETVRDVVAWIISDHGRAMLTTLDYLESLEGLAPNTINVRLAAIRKVASFANDMGVISWTITIQGPKAQNYRDTRGPGIDAVRSILSSTENVRDRLMIRLAFQMGLRRAEFRSLDLEHIDGHRLWILGKGKHERKMYSMPKAVIDDLALWLDRRGRLPGPLFLSRNGNRLCKRQINRIVKAAGDALGIKCTPHGFRHTAVTVAAKVTGGDVFKVKQFSRHARVETVQVYVDEEADGYLKVAEALGAAE